MMISTRGRYALRVMVDLAQNIENEPVSLKDIAKRQDISIKYLERILPPLVQKQLIIGYLGKNGGYKLTKAPKDYTIKEILEASEGDLAPVSCLECDAEKCERLDLCHTRPMWSELNDLINDFFEKKHLSELL